MFAGFLIGMLIGGLIGTVSMCLMFIGSNEADKECDIETRKEIVNELQNILNDKNKKITLFELKDIIQKLKKDCVQVQVNVIDKNIIKFYTGEINAFQICLDLLDHLWIGGN